MIFKPKTSDSNELQPSAQTEKSAIANVNDDSDIDSSQDSSQDSSKGNGFWSVFLSTFITIFLAELGDKTQVTTMLMSAESQSPFVVFAGAGLALVATSLIGVLLGQWLSKRISEETLDTCAGILLLLITIGLIGDIVGP
ncbi:MAG: TMEM165/GDT1 family protein [Phormidesmis sp.]